MVRAYDLALETSMGSTVSSRYISDGVLLYMAYLLLTMGPSSQSILMIEEPETGIHPGLLEKLFQQLRDLSEAKTSGSPIQVILTTHSPLLLNLVRPEEIRVVSRGKDGTTQITPFTNAPDLGRLLEFQGPGELWVNMGEDYIRATKSAG
jgi:predicted ATPase